MKNVFEILESIPAFQNREHSLKICVPKEEPKFKYQGMLRCLSLMTSKDKETENFSQRNRRQQEQMKSRLGMRSGKSEVQLKGIKVRYNIMIETNMIEFG